MKYRPVYTGAVLAVPARALEAADATADDWRYLVGLAAGVEQPESEKSAEMWAKLGVIEPDAPSNVIIEASAAVPSDALPSYTAPELEKFFAENKGTAAFLHACESILHRVFNISENNVVIALRQYRGLDESYILLLAGYLDKECFDRTGKHLSVYALSRRTESLLADGIDTYAALEEYIAKLEKRSSLEGRVRSIFGLGERKLSAKELEYLDHWASMGLSDELLSLAYDITVNATSKPSMAYTDKILTRWHDNNITTAADVKNERGDKKSASAASFDTDDFFAAAIKRSYGDKKE